MKMLLSGLAALTLALIAAPASAEGDYSAWTGGGDHSRMRHLDHPRGFVWYSYGFEHGLIDYDRGYFRSDGEAPRVENGSVRYDYDRGYPYDHYSYSREFEVSDRGRREASCVTQWPRDERSGGRVPVRVCRN